MTELLALRNVSIGYGQQAVAWGLNGGLHQGQLVALLAANGQGKSTLLRTLAHLQPMLSGEISLLQQSLVTWPRQALAQRLAWAGPQHHPIPYIRVYEYVALGRQPFTRWHGQLNQQDHQHIYHALAFLNIANLAQKQLSQLSDGQRQKVTIARCLAQSPKLMLLDEPTAFLDLPSRVQLLLDLRRLCHQQSCTVLIALHDLALALRFADRLWLLKPHGLVDDLPESLVLNGQLSKQFDHETVHFDPLTGDFQPNRNAHWPLIGLQAQTPLLAYWTKRALQRWQWQVIEPPNRNHWVVYATNNGWELRANDQYHLCSDLRDLEQRLAACYNQRRFQ